MRRRLTALVLSLSLALLPGCAPGADLARRAIVTAAAVTLREGRYRVTVEALTRLGQEDQGCESHTGEGGTFAQALTELELETGRTLYLDGCRVLLLGGFGNAGELTALLREIDAHGGIRPLTLVAAELGETGILDREEGDTGSVGEELFTLLSGGELSRVSLKDCLGRLAAPGRGILLPGVERREGELRVERYLSPGPSGVLGAPAELERMLPLAEPGPDQRRVYTVIGEDYSADWVLETLTARITPREEAGELSFLLEAKAEGYLLTARGEPEGGLLSRAQEDICRELLEEYTYLLEKIVRPSGNDLFSLGKHLELRDPRGWQSLGEGWEARLPEISVELRGSVLLRDKKRLSGHG